MHVCAHTPPPFFFIHVFIYSSNHSFMYIKINKNIHNHLEITVPVGWALNTNN